MSHIRQNLFHFLSKMTLKWLRSHSGLTQVASLCATFDLVSHVSFSNLLFWRKLDETPRRAGCLNILKPYVRTRCFSVCLFAIVYHQQQSFCLTRLGCRAGNHLCSAVRKHEESLCRYVSHIQEQEQRNAEEPCPWEENTFRLPSAASNPDCDGRASESEPSASQLLPNYRGTQQRGEPGRFICHLGPATSAE